jgi:hypothetical protein
MRAIGSREYATCFERDADGFEIRSSNQVVGGTPISLRGICLPAFDGDGLGRVGMEETPDGSG